jgi:hypothetical protein
MGVLTAALAAAGEVETAPPNPASTLNTGTGAGCTLNVGYGAGATDGATVQALAEAASGAAGARLLTPGL